MIDTFIQQLTEYIVKEEGPTDSHLYNLNYQFHNTTNKETCEAEELTEERLSIIQDYIFDYTYDRDIEYDDVNEECEDKYFEPLKCVVLDKLFDIHFDYNNFNE